eukprot:838009-Rhodomonas_salina.1
MAGEREQGRERGRRQGERQGPPAPCSRSLPQKTATSSQHPPPLLTEALPKHLRASSEQSALNSGVCEGSWPWEQCSVQGP